MRFANSLLLVEHDDGIFSPNKGKKTMSKFFLWYYNQIHANVDERCVSNF